MNPFPLDRTHDPALTSWVSAAAGHANFPIQNLPLAIFSEAGGSGRPGVAIGDSIFDLAGASAARLLGELPSADLAAKQLNEVFAWPVSDRLLLRHRLCELLSNGAHRAVCEKFLLAQSACTLHLPAAIGDYTDFYAGIHHANNVGRQFRPDNPLLPNYKYIPIGYHGRASSIRPSGVPVIRPNGQRKAPDAEIPVFGPSQRLDFELELGIWIGRGNALGSPIPIAEAAGQIAGLCLLNDWSARDLQAWEYQPLGPFLAKNFHTTISPWVVTAEALAPFRIPQPVRPAGDPPPLPYLWDDADQQSGAFAIQLEVTLSTQKMRAARLPALRISSGPASNLYWTAAQLVTHHASNGCNLVAGDLLGTGTISAPTADGLGSLLEISDGGKRPLTLPGGEQRSFLEEGDEVTIGASARAPGRTSIGFGECRARIVTAPPHVAVHVP